MVRDTAAQTTDLTKGTSTPDPETYMEAWARAYNRMPLDTDLGAGDLLQWDGTNLVKIDTSTFSTGDRLVLEVQADGTLAAANGASDEVTAASGLSSLTLADTGVGSGAISTAQVGGQTLTGTSTYERTATGIQQTGSSGTLSTLTADVGQLSKHVSAWQKLGTSGTGLLGLVLAGVDASNFLLGRVSVASRSVELFKVIGGTYTSLASTAVAASGAPVNQMVPIEGGAIDFGDPVEVWVRAWGETVSASVSGSDYTAVDGGLAGIFTRYSDQRTVDLTVRTL